MKRRSLLRATAVTIPAAALAGCADTLSNVQLGTPVTVNFENETDVERNVVITAHELQTDRQTYDESITVPTEGTANLAHLSNAEQQVDVQLFGIGESGEPVDEVSTFVDEDTQSILGIVTEDGLVLEIESRGSDEARRDGTSNDTGAGNASDGTDGGGAGNVSDGTDGGGAGNVSDGTGGSNASDEVASSD